MIIANVNRMEAIQIERKKIVVEKNHIQKSHIPLDELYDRYPGVVANV